MLKRQLIAGAAICALLGTGAGQAFAQSNRTILPVRPTPFDGTIAENAVDSKPGTARPVRAPAGSPNVLLIMSDDVGFAMSSAFGGPVPTPNYEKLAAQGERYNRFNTTGICSPSRAALLTGRNHHNAGVGFLSDLGVGYPGYGGKMLPETATIAQILRLNGYNTAMFGKHHNIPPQERSDAGPFDSWPTGLGFEYFFGFPQGDSDQYSPMLYRGTNRVDPEEGKGALLDQRLAEDAIRWVHNQKAAAPDKPFFAYIAPGSTHAPHQAPPEFIARFKGTFDAGWDAMREATWKRQLAQGIIPKGTKLTTRPDGIPAWESLTPGQKAFAARTMEVAAAQLAFQDEQVGRVLGELQRMGQLDNTMVVLIQGDNGASGEAGPGGTINELRSHGVHGEDEAWLEANVANLGGPKTYENYPVGWAWAMNTPLRWTKQFASMLGGVRNGMIFSWKGHVAKPGSVCSQFSHLIDIAPTILDATNLPAPAEVYGYKQKPMDGQSLLSSLTTCDANRPRTQYFEIGGKVGLYSDGWWASMEDGRPSWELLPPSGPKPKVSWTLYNLTRDFSQSTDLSARYPEKLAQMQALWEAEAKRNNVFPLDHRFGAARAGMAGAGAAGKHFEYWGKDISLAALGTGPYLSMRSFTVTVDVVPAKPDASGAVVAWGSYFGGWSLYLDHGKPAFVFAGSTDPNETYKAVATNSLPVGANKLTMRFASLGMGKGADVVLSAGGIDYARVHVTEMRVTPAGGGETLDIGRDLGVPVTDYATPRGVFEGEIPHVSIDFD